MKLKTKIKKIFARHPEIDILIVGVEYANGVKLCPQWNETGLNYLEPKSIYCRIKDRQNHLQKLEGLCLAKELVMYMMDGERVGLYREVLVKLNHNPTTPTTQDYAQQYRDFQIFLKNTDPSTPEVLFPLNYGTNHSIILIGYMCEGSEGYWMGRTMKEMGLDVTMIAADNILTNRVFFKEVDYILLEWIDQKKWNDIRKWNETIKLKEFLNEMGISADLILLLQNDLPINFEGIDLPFYFAPSETLWKRWPINAKVDYMLPRYHGALQGYRNAHTLKMLGVKETMFWPYAWSPKRFLNKMEHRDIFFGFMGAWQPKEPTKDVENDYIQAHIRDLRNSLVIDAVTRCDLKTHAKATEKEYIDYMNRCMIGFNAPGICGGVNQRQFHTLGMGCVLMQYDYGPELTALGYIDRKNCLLFEDSNELEEQYKWAKDHPEELEQIRQNGIRLARQHTQEQRIYQLIDFIERMGGKTPKRDPLMKGLPYHNIPYQPVYGSAMNKKVERDSTPERANMIFDFLGENELIGKRILDLGCNNGYFCFEAMKRGAAEVIGVDYYQGAIDTATRTATKVHFPKDRMHFVRLDLNKEITRLTRLISTFQPDIVLCLSIFHHLDNPNALLELLNISCRIIVAEFQHKKDNNRRFMINRLDTRYQEIESFTTYYNNEGQPDLTGGEREIIIYAQPHLVRKWIRMHDNGNINRFEHDINGNIYKYNYSGVWDNLIEKSPFSNGISIENYKGKIKREHLLGLLYKLAEQHIVHGELWKNLLIEDSGEIVVIDYETAYCPLRDFDRWDEFYNTNIRHNPAFGLSPVHSSVPHSLDDLLLRDLDVVRFLLELYGHDPITQEEFTKYWECLIDQEDWDQEKEKAVDMMKQFEAAKKTVEAIIQKDRKK